MSCSLKNCSGGPLLTGPHPLRAEVVEQRILLLSSSVTHDSWQQRRASINKMSALHSMCNIIALQLFEISVYSEGKARVKNFNKYFVIVLDYGLDDRGFESRQGLRIFLLTIASRPALGPTQLPIQWVPGTLPRGQSGRGVMMTTHLHLVQRSRMRGAIPPLPQNVFIAWFWVKRAQE
jgi:hypothetical protein